LAQHFEHVLSELGQLVQEEDAAVAQRNLAGARLAATAHQAGVRDRVVR